MATAPIAAAQYLRMSTDRQEYSLANQAASIKEYAALHGFVIVKTYQDAGRTGIIIKNRPGLRQLLNDVVSGGAAYKAVLVYDVSRWGRFQDADEAAHYEFLCRSAGVPIHYCAEQFPNDGTMPSSILKALKRTMAAEYSRELGVKCFDGQKRLAQLGFRVGGTAGYALRRLMISSDGKRRRRLAQGEYKELTTDRIVLVPGPPDEVRIVREMFAAVLRGRKGVSEIMRDLNRRGVKFLHGRPWSYYAVRDVLTNPKYAGWNAWGRTSQRLHGPSQRRSPSQWVLAPGAFAPVVDQRTFDQVQRFFRERTRPWTEEELLDDLRRLLAKRRFLNQAIIDADRKTAAVSTYCKHFGNIRRAYELIGYDPATNAYLRADHALRTRRLRNALVRRISAMFPQSRVVHLPIRGPCRPLIEIGGVLVSVLLCRCEVTPTGRVGWVVHPGTVERDYLTLLAMMNKRNDRIQSYYLVRNTRQPEVEFTVAAGDPWLRAGQRLQRLADVDRAVKAFTPAAASSASGYQSSRGCVPP